MYRLSTLIILCAGLALSACTDRFGGAVPADGVAGSNADPSSPAYFQQSVGDRVLFAVDESTLNAAARATLTEQAKWLQANQMFTAVIEGHADEQGTREYNLALGARRASAAREFLISQGVASSRLRVLTYGKERPLEVCSTEVCYSNNRRAVTVLATGVGA
ncbi:peptidoglycan-associated lipoprotein Pal [Meridianimarinicoccus aquatilis]|uniref:Peptidoglycan-associated lipoprotein n=1 Tax=Meridianimarinicoccus aquatilis TaxID=2552766 RepID=A0A4R6AUY2_9RHOB|nr:peptidoglycan-associated lipoprotein Pal [Fluviibacterium aquatile]QIE40656.1 peptidoglycan-associated lipoprotein Pal [Rhodobacteraceae bacterium SC52]TDL87897.1 peptidoglycan-associated lipoprotein Pal [Fluviibacterium aquatile]